MSKPVSQATRDLRDRIDAFGAEFEAEYRKQQTKTNRSSERRMRKLLRSFLQRVYFPYRDSTLPSRVEEDKTPF